MIRLNDSEFIAFCEMMKKEYGIDLTKKRVLIEYRLINELHKYQATSFSEYMRLIKQDETGTMKQEMTDRLTTNYTFFLREKDHFDFVTREILEKADKTKPFMIWVAGCSSGQECYSLAMQLAWEKYNKKLLYPDITIVGTDISQRMLDIAKAGEYPIEQMAKLPKEWQQRFCKIKDEKSFVIRKEYLPQLSFRYHNLMNTFQREFFDLIMCRNVMIYFDDTVRKAMIDHLCYALKDHGYLILGHAEMLSMSNTDFQGLGSSIYKKVKAQENGG